MDLPEEDAYAFIADWYDPQPQQVKKYLLKYYYKTNEVEMRDLCMNRKFLKKTKAPNTFTASDLIIGRHINLFSRQLKLADFGDAFTRQRLGECKENQIVLITPEGYPNIGKIIEFLEKSDYNIIKMKSIFYEELRDLITLNSSGVSNRCLALTIEVPKEKKCIQGNELLDGLLVSSNENIELWNEVLFCEPRKMTAVLENCTCCVIKPHILRSKNVGKIIQQIMDEFRISAVQLFYLDRTSATEFLEVYRGAVKDYNAMVEELCSGPIVALEVCSGKDTVVSFRRAAGPWDVGMAKALHPTSIRAQFGLISRDKIENAVHTTDLHEDGQHEVAYFFENLAGAEVRS